MRISSSKYPWAKWLDGRVWFVRHGHDYVCLTSSLQSQAHTAARASGVAVATRDVALGFLVQAYPLYSTWRPNLVAISNEKLERAHVRGTENKR